MDIIKRRQTAEKNEDFFLKKSKSKIKKLVADSTSCFIFTNLKKNKFVSIHLHHVDKDGNIWFSIPSRSISKLAVSGEDLVQLHFHGPAFTNFLFLIGRCSVSGNKDKMIGLKKLSKSELLIKFEPSEGYYWNTKLKRVASLDKKTYSTGISKTAGITRERNLRTG
jgi:hypothetical protein